MNEKERNERKNKIILMVKLYFDKLNYLDRETLPMWTEKALNTFLDSNLSIDEINDKIADTFKNDKDDFYIDNVYEGRNSMKFQFVDKDFEQEQQQEFVQEEMSEAGFVSNMVITTLALISFTLCGIGLALLYLIQV